MGKKSDCLGAKAFEDKLVDILGTQELADKEARRVASDSFKEVFGNWEGNLEAEWVDLQGALRQDDNGFPKISKQGSQFYYVLANGKKNFINRIKFPEIDSDDVYEITNQLRYELFSTMKNFNFNNIDNLKDVKISESIQNSIDRYRADNINDEVAQGKADLIEKYKDDFETEVRDQIEGMGLSSTKKIVATDKGIKEIDVTDDNGDPIDEIPEDDKNQGLNISENFTKNSKDNASVNIKLLLSGILDSERGPKLDANGKQVLSENGKPIVVTKAIPGKFLGRAKFVEFDDVWTTLEPKLSDIVNYSLGNEVQDVFELMLNNIKDLKTIKPWTADLVRRLEDLNNSKDARERNKITEFFQAFSKTNLTYYVTEVNGRNLKVINATATNSRSTKIKGEWGRNFMDKYLDKKNNMSKMADVEVILAEVEQSKAALISRAKGATLEGKMAAIVENLPTLFNAMVAMGINVNRNDINNFLKQAGEPAKRYGETKALYEGFTRVLKTIKDNKIKYVVNGEFSNPFDDQQVLTRLANARAISAIELSENTVVGNDGKTYWTYATISYLHNKINSWKQETNELGSSLSIEELAGLTYNKNSRWLKFLLGADIVNDSERAEISKERIQDVSLGLSSSFKTKSKNDGVDNTKITMADAINDSMVKILGKKASSQKSLFPTLTPADKSRKMDIAGFEMFETGIVHKAGRGTDVDDATSDIFIDYFEDEFNRMAEAADEIDNLDDSEKIEFYHTGPMNALKSQLFPELSPANADSKLSGILYSKGRPIKTEMSGFTQSQREALRPYVVQAIKDRMEDTIQELKENKIIETNESKALVALTIDRTLMDSYAGEDSPVHTMIGDYVVNGLIASTEYTKMFSGDPAYYKSATDMVKRVPATYTDGLQLRLTKNDHKYFNHATIKGVEVASEYIDLIKESLTDKKLIEAYKNVNTTDAQAWITPNRWKFIKQKLGQWGPQHDKVFSKMMNKQELEPKELKLAAQPLKGVYFDMNKGRPVYLKYSQAVLVPALVANTPMQRLYDKMTKDADGKSLDPKDEIHEVITIDGVKVGAKGVTQVHNNGTTQLADEFELNSSPLLNAGWKLQQDLPTKLIHSTLTGSQIQKNILAGLDLTSGKTNYNVNGKPTTGKEILQLIHDTVSSLSNDGRESLGKRFGIGEDNKITNLSGVYSALIDEFKSRGGDENIIAALEKEMPFDAIPQLGGRVQSILMSVFNKELIKIKTNGGSLIQVSPFGLESIKETFKQDNGDGPKTILRPGIKIVSDNYDGKGLKPPRIDQKTGKVLPGQVMVPYSSIRKALDTHNNSAKKEDQLNVNNLTAAQLKKLLDPSALEMVSYRIPNQGMSSNDALEIVGILPAELGDSIIAYDAVPGKTGSDFDIDKMYVMTHHLEVRDGKIQKVPSSMDTKKGKQNMLVDLYRSVLLSPHTYDSMMTSIDSAFLKDDIAGNVKKGVKGLFPADVMGNLQSFSPIQQIKTKFEYISGKFGVAQTANQLVDHVSNQSLNIRLSGYLGVGHKDEHGRTKFDKIKDSNDEHTISDVLSAFLNAYVDIAKDPYISRANHNSGTSAITFMLLRAGAPVSFVNRFVGQPILKDLVKAKAMSEGKTSVRLTFGPKKIPVSALEYVRMSYGVKKQDADSKDVEALSESRLEASIKNGNKATMSADQVAEQGKILDIFEFFEEHARSFNDAVNSAKADTKGNSGSIMKRNIMQNKVTQVLSDNQILGYSSKFENTMLGTYHNNAVTWVGDILDNSDLFLLSKDAVMDAFNGISEDMGKGMLKDHKVASVLENAFRSYSMSELSIFKDNNNNHDYLFNVLPQKVAEMKGKGNYFIDELRIAYSGGYEFLGIDSRAATKSFNNRIYRSWSKLLSSSDPEMRKLGEDLVKYSFAQSGFKNNLNQFFAHIPHTFFAENKVSGEIAEMFRTVDDQRFYEDFQDQMLRHEWDNKTLGNKLVPEISNKNKSRFGVTGLTSGFLHNNEKRPIHVKEDKRTGLKTFPKFVKMMTNSEQVYKEGAWPKFGLYIFRGEVDGNPVYTKTHKLGHASSKGSVQEYSSTEKSTKSVVSDNNVTSEVKKNIRSIMSDLRTNPAFIEEVSSISTKDSDISFSQLEDTNGVQEERVLPNEDYIAEELEVFNKKVEHLQKSMNVKVIIDHTIPTSRVLSASDPRTIDAGKPVILINPRAVFKTTAIHEFAHIFIDAFPGGLKNKRIQKALKELEGTDLYDEVKEGYPELSDEMFAKELLATAMGREGSDLWDSKEQETMWTAFKNWFFGFLSRKFGLNRSEVTSLTKELLNTEVKQNLLDNLSSMDQQQKFGKKEKEDTEAVKLETTYNQIISSIANLKQAIEPQGAAAIKKEKAVKANLNKGEKTRFEQVKALDKSLKEERSESKRLDKLMSNLNDTSNARAMLRYVDFSKDAVSSYKSMVRNLVSKDNLTPEKIKEIKFFTSVFELIPDVKQLMLEQYEKGTLSGKNGKREKRMAELDKIIADFDTINQEMLGVSRRIYAETMVEHSNEHVQNWRSKFEREYAELEAKNAKPDENIYEFVNAKMIANSDIINEEAHDYYIGRSKESLSDIHSATGWLVSEKNISSTEIQTVSTMIDAADFEVDRWISSKAKSVESIYNSFTESYAAGVNPEERYKKFVEQHEDGTYLISRWKVDFLKKYKEANSFLHKDVYETKFAGIEIKEDGSYVLDGKKRTVVLPGNAFRIKGDRIHYTSKGMSGSKTFAEAIGGSERAHWMEENVHEETSKAGISINPKNIKKWENPKYNELTSEDRSHLDQMEKLIFEADKLTNNKQSLIEKTGDLQFLRLPGVTRTSRARALAGDMKSLVSDSITDMFKKKEDEFELEGKDSEKDSIRRMADLSNKESFEVPIPFRAKLSPSDQSLDVHTILLMNLKQAKNYKEKKALEAQIDVVIDVMSNRLIPNYSGAQKLAVMHGFSKSEDIQLHYPKDKLPEDVKTLISIMESRIYGLKEKDAGEVGGANIQKATTTLLKYAGATALIGNFVNSFVNATTGTVNNLIEAWGGETYDINNWKNAGVKYWKDAKDMVNDMGSNTHSSKTNLMLDIFNVLGSREMLNNNFEDNTRLHTALKTSKLRPIASGGEHMMQAKVMYSVMDRIKILNAKGQFLDAEGNVVKTEKEAASIDEVLYFKDMPNGEKTMVLPKWAVATTFSPQPKSQNDILVETRGLIKKKIIDLHGNYDNDLKNKAQREWWGKLLFFLKKWMESTALRRFRGYATALKKSEELRDVDRFYSEDMKQYQEGYYITAIRFFKHTLLGAVKEAKFELISADYKNLSKHEKANVRRLTAEFGMMALTMLAYAAMGGFDEEPDDDTVLARYYLRRELSELTFYLNPAETIKLMKNPTASISVIERFTKVIGQLFNPTERYEQGTNEGRLKLWVKTKKALPWGAQTEKDYKASLRFLQIMD